MVRICKALVPALAALSLVSAVACASGGRITDDTIRDISDEELAQMVLALEQFGPEFAALSEDPDNTGFLDLAKASEDAFDPVDERVDLENFRFLSGHEAMFSGEPPAGGGAFWLGSGIALFESPDNASGYLKDSDEEMSEYRGQTRDGATLTQIDQSELAVGDEASIGRGVLSFTDAQGSTVEYWFAVALFRRGRVLGTVAIYAIGANEIEKERLVGKATALAQVVNDRIASVLEAGAAPAAAQQ